MNPQEINLDLVPGGVLPRLQASQYDNKRPVTAHLYLEGEPYAPPSGVTATVEGTKRDGRGFQYPATINGTDVSFDITNQMTAFSGEVVTEIVLRQDGQRIGTINMVLVVEPSALEDDTIISDTDLPLLQGIPEALEQAENFADLSQNWAIGTPTGMRDDESVNNSKYWSERSQTSADTSYSYISLVQAAAADALEQIREALGANAPFFEVSLADGHLYWQGGSFNFAVTNGHLMWEVAA